MKCKGWKCECQKRMVNKTIARIEKKYVCDRCETKDMLSFGRPRIVIPVKCNVCGNRKQFWMLARELEELSTKKPLIYSNKRNEDKMDKTLKGEGVD